MPFPVSWGYTEALRNSAVATMQCVSAALCMSSACWAGN